MQRRHLVRPVAVLAAICALTLTGCGTETREPGTGTGSAGTDRTIRAHKVMQLTQVHEETGMTLLEGPTFDSSGKLIVVDVTAPAGKPKVMRVNVEKKTADGLHTDSRGAYTSAQFSPYDGRLYLSDYAHGEVVSLAPDGSDPRTFFTGKVDGAQMNPDDIAFDEAGNLYVSDSRGLSEGKAHGRVVRIDREGEKATVLADGLAATNGISFDADYRGLWISELTQNRISYLHLDGEGGVTSKHTAIRVDGGSPRPTRSPWTRTAISTRGCTAEPRWPCTTGTGSAWRRSRFPPTRQGSNRRRTWRSRPAGPRRT